MPTKGNKFLQRFALSAYTALTLSLGSAAAFGAPVDGADPIGKLIIEKGLLAQSASFSAEAADRAGKAGNASAPTQAPRAGFTATVRDRASEMVKTAMNFLGVHYTWGGESEETGFDCSGFTRFIFERSIGLILPRRADEQANAEGMINVRRDDLRPGDLVFFNTLRRTFSHVGIYIGDGDFIHSPKPGGQVRVESMQIQYWSARFTGARRAERNSY